MKGLVDQLRESVRALGDVFGNPGLRRLLTELGYGGYITIEQERDPRNTGGILADLAASRTFLRNAGF